MMSFRQDLLTEQPMINLKKSWNPADEFGINWIRKMLAYKKIRGIQMEWDHVGDISTDEDEIINIYRNKKKKGIYIIGLNKSKFIKSKDRTVHLFIVIGRFQLSEWKIHNKIFNNIDAIYIDGGAPEYKTVGNFRQNGLGEAIYIFLLRDLKIKLMGDEQQFAGAVKVWYYLSKNRNIIVDVINLKTGEILAKNYIIKKDFDDMVHSLALDTSKTHIRTTARYNY